MGRLDSRMVHLLPAARIQFRQDPRCSQPASSLGYQTSRRSRLEIRVTKDEIQGDLRLSSTTITPASIESQWSLPYKGTVGMACLIVAESSIFTIFVVAYLYYIGKSLSGPTPREVLETPIFFTICLLSSSLTVHFASRSLEHGKRGAFLGLWLLTIILGGLFLFGTGQEWHRLIYDQGLTISTNLFGTTYYSLVGLHGFHVIV